MKTGNEQEACHAHDEPVASVKKQMRNRETLLDLAEIFKVLGDHTRVQILDALSQSELCVCALAELLNMSSSAVSHQLRVLRTAKIVKFRKQGKHVYYSLDDHHIENLMQEGLDHIQHG